MKKQEKETFPEVNTDSCIGRYTVTIILVQFLYNMNIHQLLEAYLQLVKDPPLPTEMPYMEHTKRFSVMMCKRLHLTSFTRHTLNECMLE